VVHHKQMMNTISKIKQIDKYFFFFPPQKDVV
jgi:hypothetical protein